MYRECYGSIQGFTKAGNSHTGKCHSQNRALTVDEGLAEAIRFVVDKGTPAAAPKWLDETGRQWTVNVNRVKKSLPGNNFTVERMTDFSREGALLCAVVITRIA